MRYKSLILSTFIAAAAAAPAQAADVAHGKSLQDENCTACHDSSVYTRENRMVRSLDGLEKQVRRCELSLGLQWFDDDVTDVVEYLNTSFYRF